MSTSTQDKVIEVTEASFQKDVVERSQEVTVVVDFWAPWCGPCRMLGPILERLAQEPGSNFILAKVNADHAPGLSMQYQVRGIPAVKAFRDGQVVDEFVGAQPEPRVRQFIQKVAPSQSDQSLYQARNLLQEQKWDAAVAAYRRLQREQPEQPAIRVGLAQALLGQAKGCEAEPLLQGIPAGPEFSRAETLLPLAQYLCRLSKAGQNQELTLLESRYRKAADWIKQGDLTRALDTLLAVLQENKQYRSGEARRLILAIFELLGENDPQLSSYRQKLASVLY